MDGILYLVLPIVGIACGCIGWPLIQEQARLKCEQAEREALSEGGVGDLAVTGAAAHSHGDPVRPSESDLDCGYVTVIGDTLITGHGLECSARDPWSAQSFITTAEEIGAL